MGQTLLVSIDVSARELEVRIQQSQSGLVQALTVANKPTGHRQLIRRLSQRRRTARVVLEATGVYSLDLAMALHRTPRIEVMVVNPRAANDFAKALLKRSKTDTTDADILLEFGRRMEFRPWQPPAPTSFQLRAISRRCEALTRLCTGEEPPAYRRKLQRAPEHDSQ